MSSLSSRSIYFDMRTAALPERAHTRLFNRRVMTFFLPSLSLIEHPHRYLYEPCLQQSTGVAVAPAVDLRVFVY